MINHLRDMSKTPQNRFYDTPQIRIGHRMTGPGVGWRIDPHTQTRWDVVGPWDGGCHLLNGSFRGPSNPRTCSSTTTRGLVLPTAVARPAMAFCLGTSMADT